MVDRDGVIPKTENAVEPAKGEREACYARQETELTAKRNKPEPKRDTSMEALQQMKQEDAELNRQIRGICRGC